jgi:TolC family type I secretion outer membrane protein
MQNSYRAIACAVFALSTLPAWSVDLSQAYRAALDQDATIRAARAGTDARKERVPQARAQLLPNLSASSSRFKNDLDRTGPDGLGRLSSVHENYNSGSDTLTLRQPIFRKYQFADYQQAKAQAEDAEAKLEQETQNVAVRVSGAYFDALLTSDQLALITSQKTAYITQLDAARKRLSAGAGTRTDIDEAQAALDMSIAQELEARQNVDYTRRQLQTMINMPVDRLATLDANKLKLVRPDPDNLDEWTSRAEQNSPELQSLKAQLEAQRQEVEKAKAGHYPTLDAIAQVTHTESETIANLHQKNSQGSIGLQLNVPLFSGGYVSSQVRQAAADLLRIQETLEATRRDLGVRVHKEFRGVTEGVLKVMALEQAVRSAEQSVISNRRSYEAGSRTLVDTLNAEQQRVQAQRDLAQARYMYLLSRVRLLALSGGPKAEVIDEINGMLTP